MNNTAHTPAQSKQTDLPAGVLSPCWLSCSKPLIQHSNGLCLALSCAWLRARGKETLHMSTYKYMHKYRHWLRHKAPAQTRMMDLNTQTAVNGNRDMDNNI